MPGESHGKIGKRINNAEESYFANAINGIFRMKFCEYRRVCAWNNSAGCNVEVLNWNPHDIIGKTMAIHVVIFQGELGPGQNRQTSRVCFGRGCIIGESNKGATHADRTR